MRCDWQRKFKEHKWGIIAAIIVGLISIAPQIFFTASLDTEYRGIYIMQTDNETEYMAKVREIFDGHESLGSVPYFEYKNEPALLPPTLEWLYAGAAVIFGAQISTIFIASKFVLPAILFLLIYLLVFRLTGPAPGLWSGAGRKLAGVAAAFFVVLGYDLIDFRTVISYIRDESSPIHFLLWTRPVNPIMGAILLFSTLLIVLRLKSGEAKSRWNYVFGAVFLALMIASYVYSWFLAYAILGLLALIALLQKDYSFLKKIIILGAAGFILSLPYWYGVFQGIQSPYYADLAFRTGLAYTREFIINKFLVFALILFAAASFIWKPERKFWWWASFSFIAAGFVAYNQQIITGRTVWPFHFVQYTIPLAIVALTVIFTNTFAMKFEKVWRGVLALLILISLSFGIYVQAAVYKNTAPEYRDKQKLAQEFDWYNQNAPKDCVVASGDDLWSRYLVAFTHCNAFVTSNVHYLMPFERLYDNYLAYLWLKGVNPAEIEGYLEIMPEEPLAYLYGLGGLTAGQDYEPYLEIKPKLLQDYRSMDEEKFKSLIGKYRVDYVRP